MGVSCLRHVDDCGLVSTDGAEAYKMTESDLAENPTETAESGETQDLGGEEVDALFDEVAGVEEFFPGSKWIGEVFPGDRLPPWAAEIMANDPDLPEEWWETESFQLAASGVGVPSRPLALPLISEQEALSLRHWAAVAEDVLSGLIPVDDSSEFGSIEIGLRGAHRVARCVEAHQKILAARKAGEMARRTAQLMRPAKSREAR